MEKCNILVGCDETYDEYMGRPRVGVRGHIHRNTMLRIFLRNVEIFEIV